MHIFQRVDYVQKNYIPVEILISELYYFFGRQLEIGYLI